MIRTLCAAALVALLAVPTAARAQSTGDVLRDILFTEVERRVITEYYHEVSVPDRPDDRGKGKDKGPKAKGNKGQKDKGGKGMPPGLAKRDRLPPGLAKRQTLPPGLAKRDLPPDLRHDLPPPRPGTQRVIVDRNVVLIERATGLVLDILEDVVRDAIKGN
ncbi:MAG: hypothetical protein KDE22_17575 [Rhodobacterales bacterium]|nr:hypothetical protein [Rhodobacterales bacterium]